MAPAKLFGSAVLALTLALVIVWGARADCQNALNGHLFITAHGGTTDATGDHGTISLAGLIDFFNSASVNQVDQITLVYQDSNDPADGFTCIFADPFDGTYSVDRASGIGSLKLTVGATDKCFQTVNPVINVPNAGRSITFTVYVIGNQDARIVETQINLVDSDTDLVGDGTAVGSLAAAISSTGF